MSKDIDTSDLDSLSQADLKYLQDRAVLTPEQEAEYLGDVSDEESYEDMKVADLKQEIADRNSERHEDDQIVPDGNTKADLIAALEADDEQEA